MYYKAGIGFVHPEWKQIELLEDELITERKRRRKLEGTLESLGDKIAAKGLVMMKADKKALVDEARAAIGWHPQEDEPTKTTMGHVNSNTKLLRG